MPGFPILHCLLEFAQTHVHWVGDAIQPSHPLLLPSPALSLSEHQGIFQWVSSALGGQRNGASASILSMNIQGWFPLGLTGFISLLSKGLSAHHIYLIKIMTSLYSVFNISNFSKRMPIIKFISVQSFFFFNKNTDLQEVHKWWNQFNQLSPVTQQNIFTHCRKSGQQLLERLSTRMRLYSGASDLATPRRPPRTLWDTEKRQEITGFILVGGGEVKNHDYSSPSYIHGRALVIRETVNLILNED